jgi:hypothetical protein
MVKLMQVKKKMILLFNRNIKIYFRNRNNVINYLEIKKEPFQISINKCVMEYLLLTKPYMIRREKNSSKIGTKFRKRSTKMMLMTT